MSSQSMTGGFIALLILCACTGCFKTPPGTLPSNLLIWKTWILRQTDTTEFAANNSPARHWVTPITDCRRSETLHFLFDGSVLKNLVCGQPYDQLQRGKWDLQRDSALTYTFPGINNIPVVNLSQMRVLTWDSLVLGYPDSHYDTVLHTQVVTGSVLWTYTH